MEPGNQREQVERRPRLVAGLAVPLFDRFLEDLDDARISEPFRVHELSLLLESIQKEIHNLLNTRLPPRHPPVGSWEPISEPQTVLDYGLPALSPLSAGSKTDNDLLRRTVLAKITSFEPRLENPDLELRGDPEDPAAMIGTLRGIVRLENMSYPVSFPVNLREHGDSGAGAGEIG